MYSVTRKLNRTTRRRVASVVPLSDVQRSIQLFPKFGAVVPRDWTSDNVLEKCTKFYVNCFTDRHIYGTFF